MRSRARLGLCARVGLEHAELRLHDLAERPERDTDPVGEAATSAPRDDLVVLVDDCVQLGDEAALANPWHAGDGDQLRLAITSRAVQRANQQIELVGATDKRCTRHGLDRRARARLDGLPHREWLALTLRDHRLRGLVLDHVARRAVRRLADEDAVHRRRRLEARGRVDDVARRHPLAFGRARAQQHERLAGVDREPHLEVLACLAHPVPDRERGADGPLRVVLVRERRPEERHHGVPDELLHGAAEAFELGPQVLPVRVEERTDVLRVEALRARREAHEVGEEDRDDLALLAPRLRRRVERRSAGVAEARIRRVLAPASAANDHLLSLGLPRRETRRPVLGAA